MISAKVIKDSIYCGDRVTTFELEYPRYLHGQMMTHRVFSRNAASSRAIPIDKVIEHLTTHPIYPEWTENQSGMQGKVIEDSDKLNLLNTLWIVARNNAINVARAMQSAGAHKQNVNRILEPFQTIKVVLTGTDFENFFNLRCEDDAQPEIQYLANRMRVKLSESTPQELGHGEWHLPYVDTQMPLDEALKVSASCCAQVSYRKHDTSLAKAEKLHDRLINSKPIHASPMEHQCTPTGASNKQQGNLKGFTQYRHIL